jgi:hypothetical protein
MSLALTNSPSGSYLAIRKRLWVGHAIDRFNHATDRCFGCPPYLIVTVRVSLQFGALGERFHIKRIWYQIWKIFKVENNAVWEFLWYEERGHMFECLVIRISLVTIYYVHARVRYIFLSHDSQAGSRAWRTIVKRVA